MNDLSEGACLVIAVLATTGTLRFFNLNESWKLRPSSRPSNLPTTGLQAARTKPLVMTSIITTRVGPLDGSRETFTGRSVRVSGRWPSLRHAIELGRVKTGLQAPKGACSHPVSREMWLCLQLTWRGTLLQRLRCFVGLRGVRREKLTLQRLAYRMGWGGPVDERGYFVNHPSRPAVPNFSQRRSWPLDGQMSD